MSVTAQPSVLRRLLRWGALLAFIIVALLFLNSAIHHAWAAVSPSNPYSLGLARRAIEHLCFGLAALSFGIGLFKGILTFPEATRESAAFIVLGAMLVLGSYTLQFVLVHQCHERAGGWNRATLQCSDEYK
ncbi:MAG: hypothetical protein R3F42_00825 [Pseudomonadota bacterium]